MKTVYRKRQKTSAEVPLVHWLQMLQAVNIDNQRHGFSISGKGWNIRGIMMMHLELVAVSRRRDNEGAR
jgi:hypothetical protein